MTVASEDAPAAQRRLRVLLLARYGMKGASSRIRHYAYIPHLAALGIDVTSHHLIDDDSLERFYSGRSRHWPRIARAYADRANLLRRLHDFDLVWIEKEVFPGLPFAAEQSVFSDPKVATVLDFDDLWIDRYRRSSRDSYLAKLEVAKLRRSVLAATTVTAANPHLADALSGETGRRPAIFENYIDTAIYGKAADAASAARPSPQSVRVGWIGTSYTANLYLPEVASILNTLSAQGLCEVRLIGAGAAVPQINATRIAWTLEHEARAVAEIDIGIQPLGEEAFDQHKSGWKVCQYMAAGKPVVSSDAASMRGFVEDGATGFLVTSAEDFEQRLCLLISDPELRLRMGRRAQAASAARYDIGKGAEALAGLFFDAVAAVRR